MDSLPDGGPVRYEVNRRGLDIGRDPYLDWTLPDAERFISGKHCEIRYRDGGYWLHDVSTNGTTVNGRPGRLTEPHRLEDGDRIHIGQYIVVVELSGDDALSPAPTAAASGPSGGGADPWGGVDGAAAAVDRRDFAAHNHAGAAEPAPRGPADLAEENISWGVGRITEAAPPTDADLWGAPPAGPAGDAPADDWGWAPGQASDGRSDAVGPDWRADLARHRPADPPATAPDAPAATPPGPAAASPAPAASPLDQAAAVEARAPSPEASPDPAIADAAEPREATAPVPEAEASAPRSDRPAPQADPFSDLAAAPEAPAAEPAVAAATDDPAPRSDRPAPQADPFSDLAAAASDPAPADAVAPAAPAPEHAPAAKATEPASAAPAPQPAASGLASRWADGAEAPQPAPAPAPAQHRAPAPPGGLIAAFERGAGMPAGSVAERGEEAFAEELGQLFRLVTQNLQAMLAARAETKSAMRSSERTMIGALENNPLKFSPTPEDALRIMFGAKTRSYLDATKSIESSFGDLQKHQMQTFGAMQQALQALIEDLDPKGIEEATAKDGGLAGMVGSRRAKFWDTYVERFRAKSGRHERGMIDAFMILFAEMYDRQR